MLPDLTQLAYLLSEEAPVVSCPPKGPVGTREIKRTFAPGRVLRGVFFF